MIEMLYRNRVKDDTRWRQFFDSHAQAHREAGLQLKSVWQVQDDPDNI